MWLAQSILPPLQLYSRIQAALQKHAIVAYSYHLNNIETTNETINEPNLSFIYSVTPCLWPFHFGPACQLIAIRSALARYKLYKIPLPPNKINVTFKSCILACENIRFSSLLAAEDVSRGGKSATQRQKFHTDDIKSVPNPVRSADWSME